MSDNVKRAAGLGGLLLLGVLLLSYAIGDGDGLAFRWQDDRPPIIVEDGSVHVGPRNPSNSGAWGAWQQQGSSPVWMYNHPGSPVNRMVTTVLNASCTAGQPTPAWQNGPVRITYTDGTTDYSLNVSINNGATMLRTNPGEPVPTIATATTPYRLDFNNPAYRLKSIESAAGGNLDTCTFPTGASRQNPTIMIEQRR